VQNGNIFPKQLCEVGNMTLHVIAVGFIGWDVGINNEISGRQIIDVRRDECPRAVEYNSKTTSAAVKHSCLSLHKH
jgi:hypothetical protein